MNLAKLFRIRVRFFAMLLLAGAGCQANSNERFLEDYARPSPVMIQHGQYYLAPTLAPRIERSEAITEIIKYLENREHALPTRFDDYERLQPPLRARDYWAFALANISEIEFSMHSTDNESIREEKIRALLSTVADDSH